MGLPPGKKPLMVHNGEVLIRRLCAQSRDAGCDRIVIVVSPGNCEDVVFATREFDPLLVVQYKQDGVHRAMDLGMMLVELCDDVLLLMGDNYVPGDINLDGQDPFIFVRESTDAALTLVGRECTRWVGPVYFPAAWHTFDADTWDVLFKTGPFTHIHGHAKDMGTTHEWQ